jgi:hypothetical protein
MLMKLQSTKMTIHEDHDNIGYWFQKNVPQTNTQPRTIHQDPDELGFWIENN